MVKLSEFINETPLHLQGDLSPLYIKLKVSKKFQRYIKKEKIDINDIEEIGTIDGYDVYAYPISKTKILVTISTDPKIIEVASLFTYIKDKSIGDIYYQVKVTLKEDEIKIKGWMQKSYQLLARKMKASWIVSDNIQTSDSKQIWKKWLENPSKYGWKEVAVFYISDNDEKPFRKVQIKNEKNIWKKTDNEQDPSIQRKLVIGVKV